MLQVTVFPICIKDDKYVKLVNSTRTTFANLFNLKISVPVGAVYYHGDKVLEFPDPTGGPYDSYNYEETVVYDLTGLAFKETWLDVTGLTAVRKNVKEVKFDKANKKLTVTWRISPSSWNEFYSYCSTEGRVELEVVNTCPGGHTRVFPLIVEITSRDCRDDDP